MNVLVSTVVVVRRCVVARVHRLCATAPRDESALCQAALAHHVFTGGYLGHTGYTEYTEGVLTPSGTDIANVSTSIMCVKFPTYQSSHGLLSALLTAV